MSVDYRTEHSVLCYICIFYYLSHRNSIHFRFLSAGAPRAFSRGVSEEGFRVVILYFADKSPLRRRYRVYTNIYNYNTPRVNIYTRTILLLTAPAVVAHPCRVYE